jgi:hypothetical protein
VIFNLAQVIQKLGSKFIQGGQVFNILLSEMPILNLFYHLLETSDNDKTTVVGNPAVKDVEASLSIMG